MTTDVLFVNAQQTLREIPAARWDTIGYEAYLATASQLRATDDERLEAWRKAIKFLHSARSTKFYSYVKAGGKYAGITQEELVKEENSHLDIEIEEWSMAKFRLIERVSDTLTFVTTDGFDFDLSVDDFFSLSMFRKAFFRGTNKMLPPISGKAYQKFISNLPFTVVEGYSDTKKEMIQDTLYEMAHRVGNMDNVIDSEEKAIETMLSRGRSVFSNILFFRFPDLIGELRSGNREYEQQKVVVGLRHVGARHIHSKKGNYWIYPLKGNYDLGKGDIELPI